MQHSPCHTLEMISPYYPNYTHNKRYHIKSSNYNEHLYTRLLLMIIILVIHDIIKHSEEELLWRTNRNDTSTKKRASLLHRGDATRNSTGNAGISPKKPTVKLSRTASDTRRGQEAEIRAQSRMPQTRAIVRPIVTKKAFQRHQQPQQQDYIPLRPLPDMQKGIQSEKEVDI